jgi:hypothetical protein
MITLRGHHLLCTLNYSGSGYTPAFVRNLDDVVARMGRGEKVRLTWRPDTICQPVLGRKDCHCRNAGIPVRDLLGFLFTSLALGMWMFPPRVVTFTPAMAARLRRGFRLGWTRAACAGCPWFGHCGATAKAGWPESRLFKGNREARP